MINKIYVIPLILCAVGCAGNTASIVFDFQGSWQQTASCIERNLMGIDNGIFPKEAPLSTRLYSKRFDIRSKPKKYSVLISEEVYYSGGGSLIEWLVKKRKERYISVIIKRIEPKKTTIIVNDPLPCNSSAFLIGHLFADEMVKYLYSETSGKITIKYMNGSIYSEGLLKNGLRVGEWIWWYPDGEFMQKASFDENQLNGERLINVKQRNAKYWIKCKYNNGILNINTISYSRDNISYIPQIR